MHHSLRRATAALVLNLVLAAGASAAEIRPAESPTGTPLAGVTIEGEIAPGDFVKFAALALAGRDIDAVWLASPGGNLSEALRIGRLIRQLALEVRAPVDRGAPLVRLRRAENNTCASACFFLYAAGIKRDGAVLGIHSPSLPADELFALGLDGSIAAQQRIREASAAYLDQMGVPSRYASMMVTISSREMVWLTPEDIDRDFTGVAAGYDEWLSDACRAQLTRLISGDVDCASQALARLRQERRQRTLEQLRDK